MSNNKPEINKLKQFSITKLLKMGKKLMAEQNYQKALAVYSEIWDRKPDDKDILVVLSFLLTKLAYRQQAILLLESALQTFGAREDILQILGDMAMNMEMFETAEKIFRIYSDTYPLSKTAYNNLASVLGSMERFDEAIDLMKELLTVYPEEAQFWNTLGSSVSTRDGEQAGLVFYEEAHRLDPKNTSVMNNIARTYTFMGKADSAIEMGEKVLEMNPNAFDTRFLLAACYLSMGDLDKGWKYYDARRDARRIAALIYTNKIPEWDGKDLSGKSILIMSEQGIGDEIMFSAAIKHIYEQAEQVYIGCDKRLIALYEKTFPKAKCCEHMTAFQQGHTMRSFPDFEIPYNNGELEIDYRLPIGSITKYFWNTHEDIPSYPDGFLKADTKLVKHWQKEFAKISDRPKVGIAWRSGNLAATRLMGYTKLSDWGDVLKTKGVDFINVQYSDCTEEIAEAEKKFGVKIHQMKDMDLKNDIVGSCAMFKALDLILSPGITTGWQAASVGTPVWWLTGRPHWFYGENESRLVPNSNYVHRGLNEDGAIFLKRVAKILKDYVKTGDTSVPRKYITDIPFQSIKTD